MQFHSIWLYAALFGAIIFPLMRLRGYYAIRPFIKTIMAVMLAAYCFITPNTPLYIMALGFILSALGDFFIDIPDDKGFTPGLFAFFAAHVAFIVHLWPIMISLADFTSTNYIICAAVIISSLAYYLWTRPSLDKDLVIPTALYTIVIGMMGVTAFNTTAISPLVPLGAFLFMASDVVLSIEKFKHKFWAAKEINWVLYAGGQFLLAIGTVASVGGIST
ncbi:MAG: hypothetical protein COA43_06675 [Robiginitomaculum sp.]|nr:MAG: hypothetical protein COA43_06675 [Robiginitomaculum sp.]